LPSERRLGRPPDLDLSEVVNAIFYIGRAGCPLRMMPDRPLSGGAAKDFPRARWCNATSTPGGPQGIWQSINHRLVRSAREEDD
jgi:transposase